MYKNVAGVEEFCKIELWMTQCPNKAKASSGNFILLADNIYLYRIFKKDFNKKLKEKVISQSKGKFCIEKRCRHAYEKESTSLE
jgi:hypothetical protein